MKLFRGFSGFREPRPPRFEDLYAEWKRRSERFETRGVDSFEGLWPAMERPEDLKMAFTTETAPHLEAFKRVAQAYKDKETVDIEFLGLSDGIWMSNKSAGLPVERQIEERLADVKKYYPECPEEMGVVLEEIKRDIERTREVFNEHVITGLEARAYSFSSQEKADDLAYSKRDIVFEEGWHQDDRTDARLRVLRTYLGKSCEYAANKRGSGRIIVPPQSITVHRGEDNRSSLPDFSLKSFKIGGYIIGVDEAKERLRKLINLADAAWHQVPASEAEDERVLLVINMVKKSRLKSVEQAN
jgi:hypothetical protein